MDLNSSLFNKLKAKELEMTVDERKTFVWGKRMKRIHYRKLNEAKHNKENNTYTGSRRNSLKV